MLRWASARGSHLGRPPVPLCAWRWGHAGYDQGGCTRLRLCTCLGWSAFCAGLVPKKRRRRGNQEFPGWLKKSQEKTIHLLMVAELVSAPLRPSGRSSLPAFFPRRHAAVSISSIVSRRSRWSSRHSRCICPSGIGPWRGMDNCGTSMAADCSSWSSCLYAGAASHDADEVARSCGQARDGRFDDA